MKLIKYKYLKYLLLTFCVAIIEISFCSKIKTQSRTEVKTDLKSTNDSRLKSKIKLTTKICNSLCSECSVNDINYCTACNMNTLFYNYNCYIRCPDGSYKDQMDSSCRQCSEECPVCWGPESDMCGTNLGVKTKVVNLRDEVVNFFNNYTFTRPEVDEWLNSLYTILDIRNGEKISKDDNFSTSEIYQTNRSELDLPIGAFSMFDGVFIPVPSFSNLDKELVNHHWVFKKGMWDGQRWVEQFFPRLPKFIRIRGEKCKIYYENQGYWVWDHSRDWFWIKQFNFSLLKDPFLSVHDAIAFLNTIKIDLGDYNVSKIKELQEIKKINLQNYVKNFFDNFLDSDKIIFTEMKHTFNEEQNNLINSLDELKSQVSNFFGEDISEKNKNINKIFYDNNSIKTNPDLNGLKLSENSSNVKDENFNPRSEFSKDKAEIIKKIMETIDEK